MKIHFKYFNRIAKQAIALLLVTGTIFSGSIAQEQYQTSAGLLIVKAHLDDKPVNMKSKELLIQIDYETGRIVIKQEISALKSDNDTIQSKLNSSQNEYVKFEGKLDLDYINTTGHPSLDFLVEGILYPGDHRVIGTGHLVHLDQGISTACLLSLTFKLDFDEIFPNHHLAGLSNMVYVNIIQSLLARAND